MAAGQDESTYGFSKDDAGSIVNMIGGEETETPGRRASGGGATVHLVNTGSGITARSGTTAGSGTVTICKLVSGTITTTSSTVTAYNLAEVAVPGSCSTTIRKEKFGSFIVDPPAVTDIRVDSTTLQLRRNCDWTTWHTGEDCTA